MAYKSDPQNAPYKVSRAALRDRYGARSIGGPSRQSPLDSTPSGREARAMQEGATKAEAAQYADEQFRASFSPAQQITTQPNPVTMPPVKRQMFAGGLASPEDIGILRNQGAQGTVKTPYGTVTLPPTIPATDMAEFIPPTVSPLNNFMLPKPKPYMGSVLQAASRWSRSI